MNIALRPRYSQQYSDAVPIYFQRSGRQRLYTLDPVEVQQVFGALGLPVPSSVSGNLMTA